LKLRLTGVQSVTARPVPLRIHTSSVPLCSSAGPPVLPFSFDATARESLDRLALLNSCAMSRLEVTSVQKKWGRKIVKDYRNGTLLQIGFIL